MFGDFMEAIKILRAKQARAMRWEEVEILEEAIKELYNAWELAEKEYCLSCQANAETYEDEHLPEF